MEKETAIVWFKNDLRLHDNETLCKAIASGNKFIFMYCFDPRHFKKTDLGFPKADYLRFQFLKQSLQNLIDNLSKIDTCLNIIKGKPEVEIPKIVTKYNCKTIYAEEEYADEELGVIKKLKQNLPDFCELHLTWGKTLYHINDIPYKIEEIPLTSKAYRINTTKNTAVRRPFLAPVEIENCIQISELNIPDAEEFGLHPKNSETTYVSGGETEALNRLDYYTFQSQQLTNYRWTRNRSLGMDYSSKFSPYLALGCISPRKIYETVKQYEVEVKKNASTWWIVFELVWRDYFTFKGMRMGNAIFKTEGYRNKTLEFTNDPELFKRWCEGTTGIPFVDAHMRQLNETGYMSNRGRVNCSSFLIHDYKINWTWGAAYFESKLIDYDVSANWMNWHVQTYEIWYTNPVNQSIKYNANEYIKKWIPELSETEDNFIHIPWLIEQKTKLQKKYPEPVKIHKKWSRAINKILKTIPLKPETQTN